MKKIIFVIIFNLIFIPFINAQDVVVVAPPIDFNEVETNIIKNIIEQNSTQLKLADSQVKVLYTTEKNKYVIVRLSKLTYAVSYALVTIDGKAIKVLDLDYNPKESDFELYEEKAKLNKTTTNDIDFLFVSYIDGDPDYEAIDAINNSADYAANLGYNVQVLLGLDATANAVKN